MKTVVLVGTRCHAIDQMICWLCMSGNVCTLGSGWGCWFTLGVAVEIADEDGTVMAVAE